MTYADGARGPASARCRALSLARAQGTDDPYGTLDQLDRIEARVRGPARRVVVPGGHRLHREAPEQLVREVARFLEEVEEHARRTSGVVDARP